MAKTDEIKNKISQYLNEIDEMHLSEKDKLYYKGLISEQSAEVDKPSNDSYGIALGLIEDALNGIMQNARTISNQIDFGNKLDAAQERMRQVGISLSDLDLGDIRKLIGDASDKPKKL